MNLGGRNAREDQKDVWYSSVKDRLLTANWLRWTASIRDTKWIEEMECGSAIFETEFGFSDIGMRCGKLGKRLRHNYPQECEVYDVSKAASTFEES